MEFDLTKPIEDFSGFTNAQLGELKTAALAASVAFAQKPKAEFTAQDLTDLATLVAIVDGEAAERAARAQRGDEAEALLASLSEAEQTQPEPQPEPTPEPAPEPQPETVTAAAPAATAPRVAAVAQRTPQAQPPAPVERDVFARLVTGADADAREFTSWGDVAKVAERRLASYSGQRGNGRHNIAVIKREFPSNLTASMDLTDEFALLQYAGNESRLEGGSLTAAAGWCAPSQTVYDLCELETRDGLLDVPEVQISRGGLRFTPGPTFSDIWGGTGFFHYNEAQVIAGVTKPCMEISCPDFQDVRLEVDGVCITGGFLQRRGYPELVERFIRGALVAHAHKLNAWKIAAMVTGSTAVDLATAANSDGSPVVSDTGVTGLLAAVELQIMDIRYRHRMGLTQTVEVVLPAWALVPIRADFSRRSGVELTNVTDAMINAHFALRGARVQYVYDWQDAFSGVATGPGAATPALNLPTNISMLMYPAGTWVAGVEDVIRLDTVYDSTKMAANQYTALFTEEGILMAKPCGESRVVTIALNPVGAAGPFATPAPTWDITTA